MTESVTGHSPSLVEKPNKPVIYQLLVRLFGNRNTNLTENGGISINGCGKFEDISEKALNELRDFGVTHVWYTGVIEHAVATDYSVYGIKNDYPEIVKGKAGSPYAIKDYYDVNPDLAVDVNARMDEFDALVERTHQAGLKVIIDFVPNHLSRMYHSDDKPVSGTDDFGISDQTDIPFSPANDFYYIPGKALELPDVAIETGRLNEYRNNPQPYNEFPAKATGNDCFSATPGGGDWYETVKLNYGVDYTGGGILYKDPVPPVWNKMRSVIMFWAARKVDGFRVDMAEMVPVEFWNWMIPSVKTSYPALIFIAEIYKPELYRSYAGGDCFDYLYDKMDFYDGVRAIIEQKAGTELLTRCWQNIGDLEKKMVRFLENHDEQRISSRHFAGNPWKGLPGMVVASTMNNGPLLTYFGQEVGEPADGSSGFSGDDGRTTIFDYWRVPNHQLWMSEGRFDGTRLTEELRSLRENYRLLLGLLKDYNVFSNGGFYDLMWVNQELKSLSRGKAFAYLRHNGDFIAVIAVNFSDNGLLNTKLFIPDDALLAAGLEKRRAQNVLTGGKVFRFPFSQPDQDIGLQGDTSVMSVNLQPNSAVVVLFRQ